MMADSAAAFYSRGHSHTLWQGLCSAIGVILQLGVVALVAAFSFGCPLWPPFGSHMGAVFAPSCLTERIKIDHPGEHC